MSSKTGIIAGCFDPFPHAGHLWAMEQARTRAGVTTLWVALHVDPSLERPSKAKPVISVQEREATLRAIRYVDDVFAYETEADLADLIERQKPDVRILGEDYRDRESYTAQGVCPEVFFATRKPGWDGTTFRRRLALSGTGNADADLIAQALQSAAATDPEGIGPAIAGTGLSVTAALMRTNAREPGRMLSLLSSYSELRAMLIEECERARRALSDAGEGTSIDQDEADAIRRLTECAILALAAGSQP